MVDRRGVPLAVIHTAANVHDSKVLEELVDTVAPIRKPGRGRPRKRPKKLHADKAYDDFERCRKALRKRGIALRASLGEASNRGRGWEGIGGWWSGHCRGSIATGG